jgi:hypothetical protein
MWIKGTKIERARKHKTLGLIFDTKMNWNEHSTNAKAEKNGGRPRKSSQNTQNDNTKHLDTEKRLTAQRP